MSRSHCLFLTAILVCTGLLLAQDALAVDVPMSVTILPSQSVEVSNLSFSQAVPAKNKGNASIKFYLSKTARVTIQIKDELDSKTIFTVGPFSARSGLNSLSWNGKDSKNRFVDRSWYKCVIKATDGATKDSKSIVMALTYGKSLRLRALEVKPEHIRLPKGTTKFVAQLSRDAHVNIDIKNQNGALEKSVNRLLWKKGKNSYIWNCINNKGQLVKPGIYTCRITGKDSGRNVASISEMVVVSPESKSLIKAIKDAVNGIFGLIW